MANFENITIEKGMYQTKGGISGALEKLDPSENYRGTALEDLTHFPVSSNALTLRLRAETATALKSFSEFKLCGTFPRICEQSRYAGHGESGYSPKSCGNRDRH